MESESSLARRVDAVRRFNRFYTRQIGLVDEHVLDSPFTLSEVRVLYEIAHRTGPTASEIASALLLDRGYLSRMLSALIRRGLVTRQRSGDDGRRAPLSLTRKGSHLFADLDKRATRDVSTLLSALAPTAQAKLVAAMALIHRTLGDGADEIPPFIVRSHRPGDIGWIVERHGSLYTHEYKWDARFETLVAEIAARFLRGFKPKRERCWIAERHGVNVGSVLVVERSKTIAQLRLLLVDPAARGLGIGQRLVHECVLFARRAGYARLRLWTNDVLVSARRIYEAEGFALVEEKPHDEFGHGLIGQTWDLDLSLSGGRVQKVRSQPRLTHRQSRSRSMSA